MISQKSYKINNLFVKVWQLNGDLSKKYANFYKNSTINKTENRIHLYKREAIIEYIF